MLVLGRMLDESIVLTAPSGELIEIKVVEVFGRKVRLAIDAPDGVTVDRAERFLARRLGGSVARHQRGDALRAYGRRAAPAPALDVTA